MAGNAIVDRCRRFRGTGVRRRVQVRAMCIIHCDMDAFYASVEQRDDPSIRGRPVAVGGGVQQRGVISAASYEARRYGVRSAMPTFKALRLCPGLVLVPPDHAKYERVSGEIMRIFLHYTPLVEPLSLDEAFLDVRGSEGLFGPAEAIGREIQRRIRDELGLTVSVGIGPNKFLAKLASGHRKPCGFTVIPAGEAVEFISPLPVSRLWGTGARTAEKLHKMGVQTIGEVRRLPLATLERGFGKYGRVLYELARGIDDRKVEPGHAAKSIGREVTFAADVYAMDQLQFTLRELAEILGRRLRKKGLKCGSVTLKLKYPDFRLVTRCQTLGEPTDLTSVIFQAGEELLRRHCAPPVRLLGLSCGKLTGVSQPTLFPDEKAVKEARVTQALDALKDKYGEDVVRVGRLLRGKGRNRHGEK